MSKKKPSLSSIVLGRQTLEIIKFLKVPKSTVYHVVNRFKELGTSEDCTRSERP